MKTLGLSEKSDFLEGFMKNQYRGGRKSPKKGDLDSFAGLKEGLGKKEGGFEWEMHTMETIISSS